MIKINISKYFFLLGFLGFTGFRGFSGIQGDPSDLCWFASFGCFSNFWWSKLGQMEDERLTANRHKAGSISFRICFVIAFALTTLTFLQSNLTFEILCRSLLAIVSLTFALSANLWAFLTYRFDMKS